MHMDMQARRPVGVLQDFRRASLYGLPFKRIPNEGTHPPVATLSQPYFYTYIIDTYVYTMQITRSPHNDLTFTRLSKNYLNRISSYSGKWNH